MLKSKKQYKSSCLYYSMLADDLKHYMNQFGVYLKDGVSMTDILRHTTYCDSDEDFTDEIDELCEYVFQGKKEAFFHGFRDFIFIFHFPKGAEVTAKEEDYPDIDMAADCYQMIKNYTSSDVYFTFFTMAIHKYYSALRMKEYFINAEYFKSHTELKEYKERELKDFGTMELLESYSSDLRWIDGIVKSKKVKKQLKVQTKEMKIRNKYANFKV